MFIGNPYRPRELPAGADTIFGGDGDDEIYAGNADPASILVYASSGARWPQNVVAIETGTDPNTVWAGSGNDTVHGDGGADLIGGGADRDSILGGAGNDTIYGGKGTLIEADTLAGGDGNDLIYAATDKDSVDGGNGNDTLFGGSGNDAINGGGGNDVIYGGKNNDTLTGGTGNDTFGYVTSFGRDTITDFSEGDTLDLVDVSGISPNNIKSKTTFNDGNTIIEVTNLSIITLEGVSEAEFQSFLDAGQILI